MSDERARLFAALELPPMIRTALHQWRSERLDGAPGLRMTGLESLHVTLCFLGWQPVERTDAIAEALGVLAGSPRVALSLGEPVWLPPRHPRVVAVAIEDVSGGLALAQANLAAELERGGWYEPELRRFRPHVTVARAAGKARVKRLETPGPVPVSFVGETVALMRSRLLRGDAHYERVTEVALGGPA
jgi:RNA 2',3'-cyclic 3'-phosphodiesterase